MGPPELVIAAVPQQGPETIPVQARHRQDSARLNEYLERCRLRSRASRSGLRPRSCVRWEDTGRNSVSPSTTPRRTADSTMNMGVSPNQLSRPEQVSGILAQPAAAAKAGWCWHVRPQFPAYPEPLPQAERAVQGAKAQANTVVNPTGAGGNVLVSSPCYGCVGRCCRGR